MLEIERKFLITYPSLETIYSFENVRKKDICQTYLLSAKDINERVRRSTENGKTVYSHTKKTFLTGISRNESEEKIDEKTYTDLLMNADPDSAPLFKTRYCIPYKDHILEIDIYPFWDDKAVLEIELRSEDEPFDVPTQFHVIKEISGSKKYSNIQLAKTFAKENKK